MRINTDNNCNILIYDDTEYPVKNLTYQDSVSIYLIQLNESNRSTILYNKIDQHKNSSGNPIRISPLIGGFITVCHIILPKKGVPEGAIMFDPEYVKIKNYIPTDLIDQLFFGGDYEGEETYPEQEEITTTQYFSDGEHIFKQHPNGLVQEIDLQELLEVNPKSFNYHIQLQNFFSVCQLRKCYIALCNKIFNSKAFDRCFNNKLDSQLIYKRDLVWSALNVIQYMIDQNNLAEAQRLLERIEGCNGLCSGVGIRENCGCN